MRSMFTIVKIAVQLIVALFAIDSLLSHFHPGPRDHALAQQPPPITPSRSDVKDSESWHHKDDPGRSREPQYLDDELEKFDDARGKDGLSGTPKTAAAVPKYVTTEYTAEDDFISHYVIERSASLLPPPDKSVLYLTITKDSASWGRNPNEQSRTIKTHLDLLTNTTLDNSRISIGLLTSSEKEYELYKSILVTAASTYDLNRITLIMHPGTKKNKHMTAEEAAAERESRHDNSSQHARRSLLSRLRNYLMSVSLRHESHILWLDADVYRFSSPDMVETMMDVTTSSTSVPALTTTAANATATTAPPTKRDVGLLTSRCRIGEAERVEAWKAQHPEKAQMTSEELKKEHPTDESLDWGKTWGHYDLNAWSGPRHRPTEEQLTKLHQDLKSWTPSHAPGNKMLDTLIAHTSDRDLVPLDSVGGTVLMMRADLVRTGLAFPAGYMVGMSWEHGEGWDAIETEGLCLLSRTYAPDGKTMCYTMGGDWSVWHTVY